MICRSIKSSGRKRKPTRASRLKIPVLDEFLWEEEGEDFFPRPTSAHVPSTELTALAQDLWDRFFETGWRSPVVYITYGCPPEIDAHCTSWGIIVNWGNYLNEPGRKRKRWIRDVLKHELIHWGGWTHRSPFKKFLKQMGGSY